MFQMQGSKAVISNLQLFPEANIFEAFFCQKQPFATSSFSTQSDIWSHDSTGQKNGPMHLLGTTWKSLLTIRLGK